MFITTLNLTEMYPYKRNKTCVILISLVSFEKLMNVYAGKIPIILNPVPSLCLVREIKSSAARRQATLSNPIVVQIKHEVSPKDLKTFWQDQLFLCNRDKFAFYQLLTNLLYKTREI